MGTETDSLNNVQPNMNSVPEPDLKKVASVATGDIAKATAYVAIGTSVLVAGKSFFENDPLFTKKKKQKGKTKKKIADLKQKYAELKSMSFADKLKAAEKFFKANKGMIIGIMSALLYPKISEIVADFGGAFRSYEDLLKAIDDAKSKDDIIPLRARIFAAKNRLTKMESDLELIIKLMDTIASYVEVITLILLALEVLYTALSALVTAATPSPIVPGAITTAVNTRITVKDVIDKILEISSKLLLIIGIILPILEAILSKIKALKLRLESIDNVIENPENVSRAIEANQMNSIPLGYLQGADYKGYRFFIKEDPDLKFEISGYKRHFSVALDTDNVEAYTSKLSYTSDPNVLVEELKLKIDGNNFKI